ncbi:purine-nucleoside phosphorylase [Vibrio splendidus]|uniref:Purine nucleoside phosphorylase DeoD-type n=2 Tax=Vibrionaceae TaxID=641 RepID=A0A2N7M2U2_VIBSP|nr:MULTISPECIES: purine-nucleoside phosphorylase [Vibrio]MCC5518236.1 purine-nucleoside phosphorylase [Vibrio splendidus]MDH5910334.1 purine-nucleoside phosphorylase [Vibrio splendidus]MDH5931394.1 purine-nucleoside phosphorylase [Vibrio splendidus]MDH5943944.1 purine-nucleoside phosphorylase [Vibrio splendidus]MDH5987399.1 purine-nucleoside phosphorylase [Vibrio splendidus]
MTAHIAGTAEDFASTVIMPGDPLRAKYIAETYLEDSKLVTDIRNMLGYTGYYKGQRISVMGHGMGVPSMVLYGHELINDFGVKRIIRIGSVGATQKDVMMRDVILAQAAGTDSPTNAKRSSGYHMATSATFELLHNAYVSAKEKNIDVKVGNVFTGDLYYDPDEDLIPALERFGVLGIDMEVAGLYGLAQQFGIESLAILTVSDHCITGEETTAEERQLSFNNMIEIALETAIKA